MRQGSNVDGRCDGAEMSIRDQRVGTSYSDKGYREGFTMSPLSQRTYTIRKVVLCMTIDYE